jgi:hypothetical protein
METLRTTATKMNKNRDNYYFQTPTNLLTALLLLLVINIFAGTPYFVSDSCRSSKLVYSQKIQFSIDTISAIMDTIKDSTFSCSAGSCFWTYTIKEVTTRRPRNFYFSYKVLDSCEYIDTLQFSFFDPENDSCKIIAAGFDTLGKRILSDSIWGETASRPGVEKRIFFSHRSPFRSIIPGIIEISSPSDTLWDTIQNFSISTLNSISDSAFYEKIQGAWRIYFFMNSFIGGFIGSYNDSNYGYFINKNRVFPYENGKATKTIVIDTSYWRDGWEIKKLNSRDCYEPVVQLLLNEQQLLIISQGGCGMHSSGILQVCSRDTSIKSIPVINNNRSPQSDINEVKMTHAPNKSFISISFKLMVSGSVCISIFDVSGRQILNLPAQIMTAGHHEIKIAPTNVANSLYLYRLKIAGKVQTIPIVLLK